MPPSPVAGSLTSPGHSSSIDTLISAIEPGYELVESPMPPNWEQETAPSTGGDRRPQLRGKHWAVFVAGNLILIAVVVAEIFQLFDLRLDDYHGRCGHKTPGTSDVSPDVDSAIMFLVSGLGFHVYFSTILSLVYRSPLSIESLHKIPMEGTMSRAVLFHVFCVAPFSWTLTYGVGFIGLMVGRIGSCEWQGVFLVRIYLLTSGFFMFVVFCLPVLFLSLAALFMPCSYSSTSTRLEVRKGILHSVLSKGAFLEVVRQLQGVLWIYQIGGFGLVMSVFVAICSVVGVTLITIGSSAPYMPHVSRDDIITIVFDHGVSLTSREHEVGA